MDTVFLMVQRNLLKMNNKIISYFNQSVSIFKYLLILIKFLHENLKDCQKRVSKLYIKLNFSNNKRIGANFIGNCFIQYNISFTDRSVENLFIVYELDTWSGNLNKEFTLCDCLFGAAKFTNTDPEKYVYNGYGFGLNARS